MKAAGTIKLSMERMKMGSSERNKQNSKGSGSSGQSVLEFVMVIPFMIVVVLAAVQVGIIVYSNMVLQQAAREGVRVLATTADNRLAEQAVRAVCGNDADISIRPADPGMRELGDMVTVVVEKKPRGFLEITSRLLNREMPLKASAVMRMECEPVDGQL